MRHVVVSGIGFVHPWGVGSGTKDFTRKGNAPSIHDIGRGKHLYHYDLPDVTTLSWHPDRKVIRYLRPEAVSAIIAARIALEDAGLSDADHQATALHAGVGQCYSDMWPFIHAGVKASSQKGSFDIDVFGRDGYRRMNPFFSIRTLAALPLAIIAEQCKIRGENSVQSSFGAESVDALMRAVNDIQQGSATWALVGGFDHILDSVKIENLFCNDFYQGDFHGSSSASFIILEDKESNEKRGGKSYGEILSCCMRHRIVLPGLDISYGSGIFNGLCTKEDENRISKVIVNPSGTVMNSTEEMLAAKALFPNSQCDSYFDSCGTLLAGAEPFGTILLALSNSLGFGVSLSRSINGAEGAVFLSKGQANA